MGMPARDLLGSRWVLVVGLACSGCELGEDGDDLPPAGPAVCELEAVDVGAPPSAEPSGLLSPTTDVRIACGDERSIEYTSVGVGAERVFVAAHGGIDRLYRIDQLDNPTDATVSRQGWPTSSACWTAFRVDDDGIVSMFGKSYAYELWHATPSNEDWLM
jgi:hypothetical protein